MTLPVSAESDATPDDRSLIIKLQACITGMKHPEIERVLAPSDFQPTTAAAALAVLAAEGWTTTGVLDMIASLSFLPVGTRITAIAFSYIVGGSGSVTCALKRLNLATGAVDAAIATETDATGTTEETDTLAAINHVVATGYAYFVEVTSLTASSALTGCSVKSDRL